MIGFKNFKEPLSEEDRHRLSEFKVIVKKMAAANPMLIDEAKVHLGHVMVGGKQRNVELFFEKAFKGDPALSPTQAAAHCKHYLRFAEAMRPYLIKTAQRIKRRIYMRKTRPPKTGSRRPRQ
ncbi:MAG: hypothetical protein OEY80_10615 [Nitrospirota bacterium]|nr:hypothetical protein [Nitrospirota bacterium]